MHKRIVGEACPIRGVACHNEHCVTTNGCCDVDWANLPSLAPPTDASGHIQAAKQFLWQALAALQRATDELSTQKPDPIGVIWAGAAPDEPVTTELLP